MKYFWIVGAAIVLMYLFSRFRTRRARSENPLVRAGPRRRGCQLPPFTAPPPSAYCSSHGTADTAAEEAACAVDCHMVWLR